MTDSSRTFWGLVWVERLWQDLKYGCRTLAASPASRSSPCSRWRSASVPTAPSSASPTRCCCGHYRLRARARSNRRLDLAIEAFNASSLVGVVPDYVDIRDRSKSFEGLAAFNYVSAGFAAIRERTPKLKMGMLVSGNLFPLMGVEPTIGRAFRPDEDQVPGRDAVVVLGRTMWEHEFGSDASVLGRSVRINGAAHRDWRRAGIVHGLDQFVRSTFFVPLTMSPRVNNDQRPRSLRRAT